MSVLGHWLVRRGAWASGGRIYQSLAALLVNVLLAHAIAPGDMGLYFLAVSLVAGTSIVAQLGFAQSIIRLVAEARQRGGPDAEWSVIGKALLLTSAAGATTGLCAWAGLIGLAHLAPETLAPLAAAGGVLAVWTMLTALQNITAEAFRATHNIAMASLFGGAVAVSMTLLALVLFRLAGSPLSFETVLWLSTGATATSVIVAIGLFLAGTFRQRVRSQPYSIGSADLLRGSWPNIVTGLLLYLSSQVDLWILGFFQSHDVVAVYGTISRLLILVTLPLLVVNATLTPVICDLDLRQKRHLLQRMLRSSATAAVLAAALSYGALLLIGYPMLALIWGDYFASGYPLMAILGAGSLLHVLGGSCGWVLLLTGHERLMMRITVLVSAATVLLMLALVGRFGAEGVAAAAATGSMVQTWMMWRAVRRIHDIRTDPDFRVEAAYRMLGRF